MTAARDSELARGWGIILASLLGVAFGLASFPLYALGPFFAPLQAEFGWTRQQLSTPPLILTIAVVTMSFGLGWIVDRIGPLRIILVSQLGLAAGFAALGLLTTSLASYYAIYLFMAFAAIGTLPITFNKIIGVNFEVHRGLAIGIALAGTGVGGFLAPSYATWLIGAFGWRMAYLGLALPPLVIALPAAAMFLRTRPIARNAVVAVTDLQVGVGVGAALVDYRFYAMAIAFFVGSGAVTGFISNMVPLLIDKGYAATVAARIAGTFGIAVIIGRVLVGYCLDRFWGPAVALVFLSISATGALALATLTLNIPATIMAVGMIGFATGAEFDMCAYFCGRYFGLRNFGKIYGTQYILFALGGGLAAPAFGWARDTTGSYVGALYVSAGVFATAALLLLSLGRYPQWNTPPQ